MRILVVEGRWISYPYSNQCTRLWQEISYFLFAFSLPWHVFNILFFLIVQLWFSHVCYSFSIRFVLKRYIYIKEYFFIFVCINSKNLVYILLQSLFFLFSLFLFLFSFWSRAIWFYSAILPISILRTYTSTYPFWLDRHV